MPIGKQIRAARVLLEWDAETLAQKAGLRRETVLSVENATFPPRAKTLEKILDVLDQNGIEFYEDTGVRLKDDTIRVIATPSPYLQLMDDIFYTLTAGEEALFSFVCNRLSPPKVIESQLRLRHAGIKFRALISEADNYCLYPLNEYRQIPPAYYVNNTQIVYKDKIATVVTKDRKKLVLIVRNQGMANAQRSAFNLIWASHSAPTETSAKERYL